MRLVLMEEEFFQVTLSALLSANTGWFLSEEVNFILLNWFIEGGFFLPPPAPS